MGIRRLSVSDSNSFGMISLQTVANTSLLSTLEELDIQRCGYFRSEEIHFILNKLPNLKFADFRCRDELKIMTIYSGLLPKKLSDKENAKYGYTLSPSTETTMDEMPIIPPTLWPYRNTLTSLRIGITSASIEKLCGNEYSKGYHLWIRSAEIEWIDSHLESEKPYPETDHQVRSLEISLKTGLARWSTLTALECLDVEELGHVIELEDVQWMVDHWPALRMSRGLIHEKDEVLSRAVIWLKATRPDIEPPATPISAEEFKAHEYVEDVV
ncbi:hypothetical protein BGZ49_000538 [Haplosporangium sp. Z 27]|nr:hypothetical protein BGZ49_000538 [Haplosporangium sp. Z 27]